MFYLCIRSFQVFLNIASYRSCNNQRRDAGDPVLTKTFSPKKGFTEFVMISGERFLQGVVVTAAV
jgi:hypothetical protein